MTDQSDTAKTVLWWVGTLATDNGDAATDTLLASYEKPHNRPYVLTLTPLLERVMTSEEQSQLFSRGGEFTSVADLRRFANELAARAGYRVMSPGQGKMRIAERLRGASNKTAA